MKLIKRLLILFTFISARKKWIFDGTRLESGPISAGSESKGYPRSVYAAMFDHATGLTYLFKGRKVWLYDEFSGTTNQTTLERLFRKGLHPSVRVNSAFFFYGKFKLWSLRLLWYLKFNNMIRIKPFMSFATSFERGNKYCFVSHLKARDSNIKQLCYMYSTFAPYGWKYDKKGFCEQWVIIMNYF